MNGKVLVAVGILVGLVLALAIPYFWPCSVERAEMLVKARYPDAELRWSHYDLRTGYILVCTTAPASQAVVIAGETPQAHLALITVVRAPGEPAALADWMDPSFNLGPCVLTMPSSK